MNGIELKQLINGVESSFYGLVLKSYSFTTQLMGDTSISGDVFTDKGLADISDDEWRYKCYINYDNQIFRLYQSPVREKNNDSRLYKYNCVFKPESEKLKSLDFLDLVPNSTISTGLNSVIFNGNIVEFKDRLQANLDRLNDGWTVYLHNSVDTSVFKQVTIDGSKIFDALSVIFNTYNLKYTITGKSVYIGYPSETINKQFAWGRVNGLYSIVKTPTEDKVLSRVRGCGSTRNMPFNYYRDSDRFKNPDGSPKILRYTPNLMPKVFADTFGVTDYYDDAALRALGNIDEEFITFDGSGDNEEIYPTIKGATYNGLRIDKLKFVGDIGSDELDTNGKVLDQDFEVKTNPLGFDISKTISQQGELTLYMTSGDCAGCNFKVLKINGKNASSPKVVNFYLDPKQVLSRTSATGKEDVSNFFLGSYTKFSNPDPIFVNQVGFGGSDRITNNTPEDMQFEMRCFLRGRNSQQEITFSNFNTTIVSGSFYDLSDKILIPSQTINLSADNWDILINVSINPYDQVNPAWSASINAEFSTTQPFMIEGDITKITDPISPSDQEVTLLLQKSTADFNTLLPNATLKPKIGDEFVFYNINLPGTYIIAAEQRLETALLNKLNTSNYEKFTYSIDIDRKWVKTNPTEANKIKIGNKIRLAELDEDLDITTITITKEENELLDKYDIQISPTLKRVKAQTKQINTLSTNAILQQRNLDSASIGLTQQIIQSQTQVVSTQAPPIIGEQTTHTHPTLTAGDYMVSETYNGSEEKTFKVDATPNNTSGKVIARDNNGDFAARDITMRENINTNLRLPNTAPNSPVADKWYLYIE